MARDFVFDGLTAEAVPRLAEAARNPVVPKPAATVLLVRDGARNADAFDGAPLDGVGGEGDALDGVEVFMLHRASTMAFAPNRWVFPGGGVDRRDSEAAVPWIGPAPAEWSAILQRPEAEAVALVCAAVREVFEECGVLLAGPVAPSADRSADASTDPPHGQANGQAIDWSQERRRLVEREQSLSEMLTRLGLAVRSDLLTFHAHWVTPEFEPRRYDTWFFVAAMPGGQQADGMTSEATTAVWVRPSAQLARVRSGAEVLLPPTVVCLEDVAAAERAADLLGAHGDPRPVMPELTVDDAGRAVMRAPLESAAGHR